MIKHGVESLGITTSLLTVIIIERVDGVVRCAVIVRSGFFVRLALMGVMVDMVRR